MTTAYERREWSFYDKSTWGEGIWQREPDKVQWVDEATGLDCLLHRNHMGAWCGYVGVAEGNPHFMKPYADVDANVHGGLTFADFCQPHDDATGEGICHVAYEGRPERVWWLGFDCGHAFDLAPGMRAQLRELGHTSMHRVREVYRDIYFATSEVTQLAQQLQ